ncbi:MAG: RIP metalloprotease RseP [Nitratiruptor sp.]|nr:RIP metalloprotease RseP [Nitratiruptor sp.]NPA83205.1 RIP metalloprotease RseP [Campylobacterota bacterium]
MGILTALLVLSLLIFIHELGHFTAARAFGVKVERFSIGFGPILASKECCGTQWALSAFPLGGYVKMKGQDDLDPLKRSDDPDSYNAKPPWQRIIILLAGPFANFFLAFLLYTAIALIGLEELTPRIGEILPNSPAQEAGLRPGDRIVAINGKPIQTWSQLSHTIAKSQGTPLRLLIERQGEMVQLTITPKRMKSRNIFGEEVQRPMLGISPGGETTTIRYSLLEALRIGWQKTIDASLFIVKGIEKMVEGAIPAKELGGVITIMDVTAKASQVGLVALLSLTALISVNLAILNLLPIPALDGGHILFNLYEWIARRPPNQEVLYRLTLAGWIFLIALMGLGLYNDINRLIGAYGG